MGRTLTPDGKRCPVSVKVSQAKYDAIESARDAVPRALWLEAAVDAALGGSPVAVAPGTEHVCEVRADPGTAALRAELEDAQAEIERLREALEASRGRECRHPSSAVRGGTCGACGADVW